MNSLAYIIGGAIIMMLPVIGHFIEEFNKPKEITHIRHYNQKDELIRYYIHRDGNIEIQKSGDHTFQANSTPLTNETFYCAIRDGEKISDTHAFCNFNGNKKDVGVVIPTDGEYTITVKGKFKKGNEFYFPKVKDLTVERTKE